MKGCKQLYIPSSGMIFLPHLPYFKKYPVCTFGFLYSVGQLARPGDGPGGVQKAISRKWPKSPGFASLCYRTANQYNLTHELGRRLRCVICLFNRANKHAVQNFFDDFRTWSQNYRLPRRRICIWNNFFNNLSISGESKQPRRPARSATPKRPSTSAHGAR